MYFRIYVIGLFLAVSLAATAQQRVEYGYDRAGNRITRQVVTIATQKSAEFNEPEEPVEQEFGQRTIRVYPNPTRGNLSIDVQGGSNDEVYRYMLFDMQGKQLLGAERRGNGNTPVEMGACPAGYYILIINTADGKIEYKIVKE
ncbi:MAG: T9SS type A sorting domain-containing protein [Cytophagaceae bacterium]|jgi:hypothetical protein|nr:T9SS type A sorting domain-containing protein [Cytophagaceae bacterium]